MLWPIGSHGKNWTAKPPATHTLSLGLMQGCKNPRVLVRTRYLLVSSWLSMGAFVVAPTWSPHSLVRSHGGHVANILPTPVDQFRHPTGPSFRLPFTPFQRFPSHQAAVGLGENYQEGRAAGNRGPTEDLSYRERLFHASVNDDATSKQPHRTHLLCLGFGVYGLEDCSMSVVDAGVTLWVPSIHV